MATRLRQAAGIAVLAVLAVLGVRLIPIYFRNHQLEQFVEDQTRSGAAAKPPDDVLRARVLERASQLELPVVADNVHIDRSGGTVRIEVRYAVRVDLPLYTVDLHFYPGAGSR
jgi:hypothetical protein